MGKRHAYFTEQRRVLALRLAGEGCSMKEISKALKVAPATFRNWRRQRPDFEAALFAASQATVPEVEAALFKSAVGYSYTETEVTEMDDGDGHRATREVKKVKRTHPNIAAAKYILNNRRPDRWKGDKPDLTVGNMRITVLLPGDEDGDDQAALEEHQEPPIPIDAAPRQPALLPHDYEEDDPDLNADPRAPAQATVELDR